MKLLTDARRLLRRAGIDVSPWPHRPEAGVIDWGLAEVIRARGINCVIDVGGNRGHFAQRVRELGFTGRIVSFEPSPTTLPVIRAAAERDPGWTVRPVALSSEPGQAELHLHKEPQLDSMLEALPGLAGQLPIMTDEGTVTVTVSTLAAELPAIVAGIAEPRILLKSDTQGYDARVIRGAGPDGLPPAIAAVLVELAPQHLYSGQPEMTTVLGLIMSGGFSPVAFEPFFYAPDGLRIVELDALFMRAADDAVDWGQPDLATQAAC